MSKPIPPTYETLDSLIVTDDGTVTYAAAHPAEDSASFSGYLAPFYTLTDRGTFFVPGAFKKTAKERRAIAPHLYQHDTWEPIGKHADAYEDATGFRISVDVNEQIQRGAELMSNLRFGTPLALSIGFDIIRDRSGNDDDKALLNRKTAPDYFQSIPITELRAIEEVRFWESSSVTFPGLATAKPDIVHRAGPDHLASLLTALNDGTATAEQLAAVEALVAAYQQSAALSQGTDELAARRTQRRTDVAAALARHAGLLAQGLSA